jgi:alkaline phosphatase D
MAAHASAPWIVSWDDHEVDNNYAGDFDEQGTPPELFLLRRAAAYQAYYEMMPLRPSALPSGSHMRIYRRLQFGNLIDFSVLDTRQWRSDQPCGDGLKSDCAEALSPSQTMMGDVQERWLFDNLATVKAKWTVLGQQVYSFAFDRKGADPNGRFSMDKWDGYVAARQRLYNRLLETKAPNPIVLSGDVHQHYGADLKADFTNPRSATVGVEFTNSAVTTTGDGSEVGPTWEAVRADNPHIKYHSNRRGYIACTATPEAMRADFKILDRVSVPDLPARTGGSLVVHAGRAGSNTD